MKQDIFRTDKCTYDMNTVWKFSFKASLNCPTKDSFLLSFM